MNFGSMFHPDSLIWKYMGRVWDAIWLTCLWILCSLPIVTIGAASTAVSYVAMKIMKDEEGNITKQFFHSFRQNFRQATVIWLGMLFFGIVLGINFWFYYHMENTFSKVFMIVLLVLAYVLCMLLHYIFPVLARFDNSVKNLLVMAFVFAMRNFGWTMLMIVAAFCVAAIGIFAFAPLLAGSIGMAAMFDAWVINPVFDAYIKKNKQNGEEE